MERPSLFRRLFGRQSEARPSLLSRDDYLATFSGQNVALEVQRYDLAPVWRYVKQIPAGDHDGYDVAFGDVQFTYRTASGEFEHVMVSTTTPNAFIVVIVDAKNRRFVGHHLLDLNHEYGIEEEKA